MDYQSAPDYSGYSLDIFNERGYFCVENLTLEELAAECCKATERTRGAWPSTAVATSLPWRGRSVWRDDIEVTPFIHLVARSSHSKLLDVNLLLQWHLKKEAKAREWRWARRHLRNWNGEGPVPGTSSRPRYGSYIRRPHTQAERRQACWLEEEGEPRIRAARRANYLPTRWDDQPRCMERGWKSQHKGRKSWDKP